MQKRELTVSMLAANVYALVTGFLPAMLWPALLALLWGAERLQQGLQRLLDPASGQMTALILLFIPGIFVHELLHALGWVWFGKVGREAIRFGFQWKTLTPYAHCQLPMTASAYCAGGLLPGLMLGAVPGLLGALLGSFFLVAFGFVFTAAAGGDFLILWLLRGVSSRALVEDHPSKAGCYVLEPQEAG
jgi:hypothetical protein